MGLDLDIGYSVLSVNLVFVSSFIVWELQGFLIIFGIHNKHSPETVRCRDFSNYEPNSLRNDLRNESFVTVYAEENPNQAWKCMKSILEKVFDHHAPYISKRVKGKNLFG